VTEEWTARSLRGQGICILITPNPTVTMDLEDCNLVSTRQGTQCLSTFPDNLWRYLQCLKGSQSCLAVWAHTGMLTFCPFLYVPLHRPESQKISAWNTVACMPSEKDNLCPGLTPHTCPDPPTILDSSIYQTSPLDWMVTGQVNNHFLHFKGSPKRNHWYHVPWLISKTVRLHQLVLRAR
jgi:hypothetical protein